MHSSLHNALFMCAIRKNELVVVHLFGSCPHCGNLEVTQHQDCFLSLGDVVELILIWHGFFYNQKLNLLYICTKSLTCF